MTKKRSALAVLIILFALVPPAHPQRRQSYGINYRLGMSNPLSHLFEVTVDFVLLGEPPFVDLQIPSWQPGRYSAADFAKNVQEFNARAQNRSLSWTRIDDQTWRVQTQGNRSITVAYKVFGNDLSGTFAQL